jgi:hypothetical protein
MAKRKRALPTRKPRDRSRDDESLLLRSAESLGRVIGALQRQLDGATKRLSATANGAWDAIPSLPGEKATRRGTKVKKRSAATKSAGAKKTKSAVGKKVKKQAPARKTRRQ